MSIKDDEMKELITDAKKQVKTWYNSKTSRKFIKTQIWSASNQFPGKSGSLTELYVLEGGEAKGTIIADYYNGVVTCYDMFHTTVMTRRTTYNDRRYGETLIKGQEFEEPPMDLETRMKVYDWVTRPDNLSEKLFCEIMDEACSYNWWQDDPQKDYWWDQILEANKNNPMFYGENSFFGD